VTTEACGSQKSASLIASPLARKKFESLAMRLSSCRGNFIANPRAARSSSCRWFALIDEAVTEVRDEMVGASEESVAGIDELLKVSALLPRSVVVMEIVMCLEFF